MLELLSKLIQKKELEDVIYQACPYAQLDWYFSRPAFQCNSDEKIIKCVEEAYPGVNQIGVGIWTDDIDTFKQKLNILFDLANLFLKVRTTGA